MLLRIDKLNPHLYHFREARIDSAAQTREGVLRSSWTNNRMVELLIGVRQILLIVAGVFTLTLGLLHFFFPILLDFTHAIPREGEPLRPFRLGPITYATRRSDVLGIAWVMNHAASYTLVSIGIVDLMAGRWLDTPIGRWLALWIAGWWLLRAASQLYLGRRRGHLLILAGFAVLSILHAGVALL